MVVLVVCVGEGGGGEEGGRSIPGIFAELHVLHSRVSLSSIYSEKHSW